MSHTPLVEPTTQLLGYWKISNSPILLRPAGQHLVVKVQSRQESMFILSILLIF